MAMFNSKLLVYQAGYQQMWFVEAIRKPIAPEPFSGVPVCHGDDWGSPILENLHNDTTATVITIINHHV